MPSELATHTKKSMGLKPLKASTRIVLWALRPESMFQVLRLLPVWEDGAGIRFYTQKGKRNTGTLEKKTQDQAISVSLDTQSYIEETSKRKRDCDL